MLLAKTKDLFPEAGSVMPAEIRGLLKTTLHGLVAMLDAEEGSLCWMDASRQELVVAATVGSRTAAYLGCRQPPPRGVAARVFTNRQPLLVRDLAVETTITANRAAYRTQSFLCVPVQTPNDCYGVINLTDKITGEAFCVEELERATQTAAQLATALDALQHSDSLRRQVELAEKFAAIGRLAAGLVHELSNQLDGMNRYATLLLESVPEGHLRDYLLQIKSGLNRMTSTVRSLGQFARMPHDPNPVLEINPLIEETLRALGLPFGYPNVTVVKRLDRKSTRLNSSHSSI